MCRHRRAFVYYLLLWSFRDRKFIHSFSNGLISSVFCIFLFFSFSLVWIDFWMDRDTDSIAWTKRMFSKHIISERTRLRQCNVFQYFLNSIVLLQASVRVHACMVNAATSIFFSYFTFSLAFEFIYFQIFSSSLSLSSSRFFSGAATTLVLCMSYVHSYHTTEFDWMSFTCIYIFGADYRQRLAWSSLNFWLCKRKVSVACVRLVTNDSKWLAISKTIAVMWWLQCQQWMQSCRRTTTMSSCQDRVQEYFQTTISSTSTGAHSFDIRRTRNICRNLCTFSIWMEISEKSVLNQPLKL